MVVGCPLLAVNRQNAMRKASTLKLVVSSKWIARVDAHVNKHMYDLYIHRLDFICRWKRLLHGLDNSCEDGRPQKFQSWDALFLYRCHSCFCWNKLNFNTTIFINCSRLHHGCIGSFWCTTIHEIVSLPTSCLGWNDTFGHGFDPKFLVDWALSPTSLSLLCSESHPNRSVRGIDLGIESSWKSKTASKNLTDCRSSPRSLKGISLLLEVS